ncbi:hypothetical protein ACU635_43635 [[Actinomadura] parvosata]|uniref:hypothetical protein n=1 Tax=[Actinomadura] parvosata TaxID=1955412 RepID=UPI00406BEBAF
MSETKRPKPETPEVTVFPSWEEICFPDGRTPWADERSPASTNEQQSTGHHQDDRQKLWVKIPLADRWDVASLIVGGEW